MNTVFALICILLLYLLQKVLYGRYWDKGLDIRLSFSADHAREGSKLNLYEQITNRKAIPLPVVKVKFDVARELIFDDTTNTNISDHIYRNDVLSCLMYQKITRTLSFTCGKRGYYTIDRVDAVGSDLFLSTNFVSVLPMQLNLSVYPKLITDKQFDSIYKAMLGNTLTKRLINDDPFEFRGIREYQPFDPDSKIVRVQATDEQKFHEGEFLPVLDGATALFPVYSAVFNSFLAPRRCACPSRLSAGGIREDDGR